MTSFPTKNNFDKPSKSIGNNAYILAQEIMKKAGTELTSSGKTNTGISVDGTWQKNGYVSLNGCVAVLSFEKGKVLDIEAMSRYCKSIRKTIKNLYNIRRGKQTLQTVNVILFVQPLPWNRKKQKEFSKDPSK